MACCEGRNRVAFRPFNETNPNAEIAPLSQVNGRPLNGDGSPDHLTDAQLAGYLDRSFGGAEGQAIEAHLEACADCRLELIETTRTMDAWQEMATRDQPVRTRSRRFAFAGASMLMAASLAALLLIRPDTRPATEIPHIERATNPPYSEGLVAILAVEPPEEVSALHQIVFTWQSVSASRYRLTLSDAAGSPIWVHDTADTTAVLPADIRLEPGRTFFWNVDGVTDGVTSTTRTRPLTITR